MSFSVSTCMCIEGVFLFAQSIITLSSLKPSKYCTFKHEKAIARQADPMK